MQSTLVDALNSPRERVGTARGWGRGSNTATSRNRITLAQPPSSTEGSFLLSVTSRGIRLAPQNPLAELALLVADFCGFPGSVFVVQKVSAYGAAALERKSIAMTRRIAI